MNDKEVEPVMTETVDNGTIENVHISPIGEFVGSDPDGNPVQESITLESLEALAEGLNEGEKEVLCDVDHGAARPERDTKAAGWFSRFVVDPIKGLFARLKLTRHGRELLENREYRFISPTFGLDEEGRPVELHTASLTNTPAFAGYIDPVLNQEAREIKKEKGIEDMTEPELVDLIKKTVAEMKAEETKAENACSEETKAENACSEETEVKNAETEEVKEEVKEEAEEKTEEKTEAEKPETEEVEETKEEEEVIKIETLNQAPRTLTTVQGDDWQNLHGEAFWKWLREHPEAK